MNKSMIAFFCSGLLLGGCDGNQNTQAVAELVKRSQSDLIFVAGGEFMMGDIGRLLPNNPDGLSATFSSDNKPMHKVQLDSFSISRFQVTFKDYLVYQQAIGQSGNPFSDEKKPAGWVEWEVLSQQYDKLPDSQLSPVFLPWQEARDYCQWLGKQSGLNYDLATEAQWEYAARSGGKVVLYATDTGEYEYGLNVPIYNEFKLKNAYMFLYAFPVGSFPPNPLGIYDMHGNGWEWTLDWYDPTYYRYSPMDNPQGPKEAVLYKDHLGFEYIAKVMRGKWINNRFDTAISRYPGEYLPTIEQYEKHKGWVASIRCVVNQTTPVN